MGSPLAPIVAHLFMDNFESDLLNRFPQMKLWLWFVHDVYALHSLTDRCWEKFLSDINSINPKILFTLKHEKDNKLPFLDVLIEKNKNGFVFDVYRKPTFYPRFIDGTSFHPLNQKLAFINCGIERIFNLELDSDKQMKELEFLRSCCHYNNLCPKHVDRIFQQIKWKRDLHNITTLQIDRQDKKFMSLPFDNFNQMISKKTEKIGCCCRLLYQK